MLRLINTVSYRAAALGLSPPRCPGLAGGPGPLAREGVPLGYARDLATARCRFRSTRFPPRSTGRLVDPPASPRVPGCRGSKPKERGRSEVKRSRAGFPHGEPRTEPPSEAAGQPLAAIPLDAIFASLHRPLIGTPRCAWEPGATHTYVAVFMKHRTKASADVRESP